MYLRILKQEPESFKLMVIIVTDNNMQVSFLWPADNNENAVF